MPAQGRLRDMTGGFDVDDSAVIDENIVYIEGLVQVDHYLRTDGDSAGGDLPDLVGRRPVIQPPARAPD